MTHRATTMAAGLVLMAVTAITSTGPAIAARPETHRMHVDDTFLSRISEDCGYDVLLHLEGTITVTDFTNRDGTVTRTLVTYPALFFTFINAATGEAVTSRSPDVEHYRYNDDGSLTLTVTGLVMHVVVPGEGVQAAQAGRFVVTIDADGNETVTEPVGRNDDYHAALCATLAP
jgi:hypothetical protein